MRDGRLTRLNGTGLIHGGEVTLAKHGIADPLGLVGTALQIHGAPISQHRRSLTTSRHEPREGPHTGLDLRSDTQVSGLDKERRRMMRASVPGPMCSSSIAQPHHTI